MRKLAIAVLLLILAAAPAALAAGLVPCGGTPRCCETGETPPSCVVAPCGDSPLPRCCDPGETAGHLGCVVSTCEYRCQFCDFFVMAERIINFLLFTIVPPLAVLFVVIAGAYFILGSGYDPGLVIKGKSMLLSVAIGLLILYGSWILINLFFTMIGVASWTGLAGGWWQINCPTSSSSLPASFTANLNAQMTAPGDPAFFVGVNQLSAGEDIPLPPF